MKDESFRNAKPQEKQVVTVTPQAVAARFSSCGEYVVAGCFDGEIRRFQQTAENQLEEVQSVKGHGGWVEAFVHHPSEPICYSGDSWGKLQCWSHEPEKPKVIWSLEDAHDGWIRSVDVDSDGKRIATCGLDRTIRIRGSVDGKLLHEFAAPESETFCVRFHPTRDEVVCGDLLGRVLRWNLESGKPLESIDATDLYLLHRLQDVGGVRVIAFDAKGEHIAVAGTRPKNGATVQGVPTVLVFNYDSGAKIHELKFGAANHCFVHDIVIHPDGYVMAVTSGTPGSGQVIFQALGDEAPFYTHTKIPNCHSISLHPDGRRYVVAATNRGSNGNGRRLNKEGEYEGNNSPIHMFQIEQDEAKDAQK